MDGCNSSKIFWHVPQTNRRRRKSTLGSRSDARHRPMPGALTRAPRPRQHGRLDHVLDIVEDSRSFGSHQREGAGFGVETTSLHVTTRHRGPGSDSYRNVWAAVAKRNPRPRSLPFTPRKRGASRRLRGCIALREWPRTKWGTRQRNRLTSPKRAPKQPERSRNEFRLPLGGAEYHHHQAYVSTNVRKTLDTTKLWTPPTVLTQRTQR